MLSRIFICFLWMAASAQAQVAPLIFERETITIQSPASTAAGKDGEAPINAHPALSYDVEIRPEDALRLEYIHTLNNLTDRNGVMIAFSAPSVVALPVLQAPTAVDALFIMNDGTIAQILPNVILAEMTQEIVAREPIKAFLFLKAGTAAVQKIRPLDVVSGKKFTAAPPFMK
jgi:hypothetical protein